jgi:hypothetical protein
MMGEMVEVVGGGRGRTTGGEEVVGAGSKTSGACFSRSSAGGSRTAGAASTGSRTGGKEEGMGSTPTEILFSGSGLEECRGAGDDGDEISDEVSTDDGLQGDSRWSEQT